MLLVKTRIGQSKIHGTGLFADQFIPKGTIVWRFDPGIDLKFKQEEISELDGSMYDHLYLSTTTGLYLFCNDDAKYMNHSLKPTLDGVELGDTEGEGGDIAIRDIEPGEELTYDYEKWELREDIRQKVLIPSTTTKAR